MSRNAYDAIGGHDSVRGYLCEDVAIARLIKNNGFRPRVSWGNDYASVRMYDNLSAIIRGWGRIYYAARFGQPWTILAALAFVIVCMFSCYPAMAWGAGIAAPNSRDWRILCRVVNETAGPRMAHPRRGALDTDVSHGQPHLPLERNTGPHARCYSLSPARCWHTR